MNFIQAVQSGFRNYGTFEGRAPRSEFWFWVLFAGLVRAASFVLDHQIFPASAIAPLSALTGLGLFLPGLAVTVRRLHDTDHGGWWFLICMTGIGMVPLLIWYCRKGTGGDNRFGPDPLEQGSALPPPYYTGGTGPVRG